MKKEIKILQQISYQLSLLGYQTNFYTEDVLDIEGLAMINIESDRKHICLSFEFTAISIFVANLTKDTITCCKNIKSLSLEIYEPYHLILNEDGVCVEMLFGEDVIEYFETGEIRSTESKQDGEDAQKKIDSVLDQISSKGVNSLNEEQKNILKEFSKNKKS